MLSHGDIDYSVELTTVTTSGPVRRFHKIYMAGMRITSIKTSSHMSRKLLRVVYKRNLSLKAGFKHRDIILNALVFKMMLAQSWVITMFKANFVSGDDFVSTSGPCLELENANLPTLHAGMSLITTGLKTMTLSIPRLVDFLTMEFTKALSAHLPYKIAKK